MNAMRSRCALFMLAWILKTKAENCWVERVDQSPSFAYCAAEAAVVMRRNCFKERLHAEVRRAPSRRTPGVSSPLLHLVEVKVIARAVQQLHIVAQACHAQPLADQLVQLLGSSSLHSIALMPALRRCADTR